ncbi:MAG: GAF and ANTAR domain-containing protein [Labedaea sp.]
MDHSGARAAIELQELLLDTEDIQDFLDQLARVAAAIVAGGSCGITLRRDGRAMTVASSDDRATRVDEVQYGHDQGPCLSSLRTGEINVIDDLAEDMRWGDYRMDALAHGIRSSVSIPLRHGTHSVGALNLYSDRPHAFGTDEQAEARRFGAEAGRVVALAVRLAQQAELAANLKAALTSRSTIDQAIGVIMGQNRCTADEAFHLLRSASQNRNVKLREVAAQILSAVSRTAPPPTGT